MEPEVVVAEADGIYRWDGPKRKQTLLSGTLGRVVLTNQRLLFLSTGNHDVTVGKAMAGAAQIGAGLSTASTSHLDESALANKGSAEISLASLTSVELKGMFKYLSVSYTKADGSSGASAFAPKNGGMPSGAAWVSAINDARGTSAG